VSLSEQAMGMGHLSEQAHCGGPMGRAPLLGTLKDMLSKGLEWMCFNRGPTLGEHRGTLLLQPLR
jgi:hypothetical protein